MEDQDLLTALEDAYQRGVTFEQIQTALSENPDVEEDALEIAQEFYSKKKDSTEGLQEESLSVSESELVPDSTGSVSSQAQYDANFLLKDGLSSLSRAYDRGVNISQIEEKFQGNPEFVQLAKDYYQTLDSRVWEDDTEGLALIVDDNPGAIGRFYNQAAAPGRLASEIAKAETTGDVNWENIAYLNSIMQRDGVKKTGEENPVLDFAKDALRAIVQSPITMATAYEAGVAGAAGGAAVTAPIGGVGAVPGFFAASSLAIEYASTLMDVIREEGIDVTDADQLAFASQNEELMSRARKKALKRGIPVAVFDGISGGLAGKVGTSVVKSVGKSATNRAAKVLAAETLVQAGLGAGGEFAGQVISGDEISPREIALEAFAELGPAAPVMAYNLMGRVNATPGELEWKDWASSVEDQSQVVTAQDVADKVGNINELNNKIDQVRAEDVSGTEARKTKRELIRKLKDEKYREKTKIAKQFMELNEEKRALAELTSKEIDKDAKSIQENPGASNTNEATKQRIKDNIQILNDLLGQPKTEPTTQQEIVDDQETLSEKVPGDIEAGQEPGRVPDVETSEAQTEASRILQARGQQEEINTIFKDVQEAKDRLLSDRAGRMMSVNLYDTNEAEAFRQLIEEGTFKPKERKYLENMILASEAHRKMFPKAKEFVLGFGDEGYKRGALRAGFSLNSIGETDPVTNKYRVTTGGITNPVRKGVAIKIPLKSTYYGEGQSRGPSDRFSGLQTAYHEMFHNLLRNHFAQNNADFNQFRKLIIRRLSESDVKDLNDFAKRYETETALNKDRRLKTLPSEEFMVQLGGLLANKNIKFQPTFLEELKAFIANIIKKITGGRVQFFKEASLANDLANYMKGTSEAMRMGGDPTAVVAPESLKTDRFKRVPGEVDFKRSLETDPKNAAGLKDPVSYDKELNVVERFFGDRARETRETIRSLEKKLKKPLRRAPRDILVAQEIAQSVNIPHLKNLSKTSENVRKLLKKMSPQERERVIDLVRKAGFNENKSVRSSAMSELLKTSPKVAEQVGRFISLRKFYQDAFKNNPVFDTLDADLMETIIANQEFYGTRTYKAFTDPKFKFDNELEIAAETALVTAGLQETFNEIKEKQQSADIGKQIALEMLGENLDPRNASDVSKYAKSQLNTKKLTLEEIKQSLKDSELYGDIYDLKRERARKDDDFAFTAAITDEDIEYYNSEKNRFAIEDKVRAYLRDIKETADQRAGRTEGNGMVSNSKLSDLRVGSNMFKRRQDLPVELRNFLGEQKDPFIKFATTIEGLSKIYAKYGLVSRVNEAALRANTGDIIVPKAVYERLLNDDFVKNVDNQGLPTEVMPVEKDIYYPLNANHLKELLTLAQKFGAKESNMSIAEFLESINVKTKQKSLADNESVKAIQPETIDDFRRLNQYIKDYFKDNFTIVSEKRSPLSGQAVRNQFTEVLNQTPLYSTKGLAGYYKILLQMRRTRVIYNAATWVKNILGGYYFQAANGILPIGDNLDGYNIMKDLKVRLSKMAKGEFDPETQKLVNETAELGLLGSSLNAALFRDINDAYIAQMEGATADKAWSFLEKVNRQGKIISEKLVYQYGAIDDYTKIVAFAIKRENFAKRLASNPEGRSFSELTDVEKQQVNEMTAERIKQNFPTMSRINPAFRILFGSPLGDFLSFRVEAFRSFLAIYQNAINDMRESVTNDSLTASQRKAYAADGVKAITMGSLMAMASASGYQLLGDLLTGRDEEEQDLAMAARGTNLILPPWMQGANIIPIKMEKNGDIRYVNMSSTDPYDEIQGLIYGRDGITRYDNLMSILKDFKDPNMAIKLLFNLMDGKNQYGADIVKSEDLNWFNRNLIPTGYTHWDETLGTYALKEVFIPPNIAYIERQLRQRAKELEKNPDAEMDPLNAIALSTNVFFRDYPVNISKQFYYNMRDQNFREPYMDMEEGSSRRKNRKVRLDEVKRAYEFAVAYSSKFENPKIIQDFERTIKSTFRKSKDEQRYILYDVELPE